MKGPIYEGRLANFSQTFLDRRDEIQFALQMHMASGVDQANTTLGSLSESVSAMDAKLDMAALFRRLDSPAEREIGQYVESHGGAKACMANDAALADLEKLARKKEESAGAVAVSQQARSNVKTSDIVEGLRVELSEDVEQVLKKNMVVFERKFEMQKRQLEQMMTAIVKREGDRVISAVISGPHDRILDPVSFSFYTADCIAYASQDLHEVWKEMVCILRIHILSSLSHNLHQGWKSTIKARHFVLALHDYFVEEYHKVETAEAASYLPSPSGNSNLSATSEYFDEQQLADAAEQQKPKHDLNDKWALAYLNILHVQPILEAFDDDGTGFVSVKEANEFTSSRPKDWRLAATIFCMHAISRTHFISEACCNGLLTGQKVYPLTLCGPVDVNCDRMVPLDLGLWPEDFRCCEYHVRCGEGGCSSREPPISR